MSSTVKPALPAAARRKSAGDALSSPRQTELQRPNELPFAPLSEEANVQVVCRVRPFNQREMEMHAAAIEGKAEWEQRPLRSVVEFSGGTCAFLDSEKDFQEKERFQFDACLWSIPDDVQKSDNEFATQAALFDMYGEELLKQAWKGFNTCFFAYGQTGSGKTHSMMGRLEVGMSLDAPGADPGLIPRLCKRLFDQVDSLQAEADKHREHQVQTFRVEVRYMELYNEMCKDLLWSKSTLSPEVKAKATPENLKIRSSPATGVFVEHLTAVEVKSWEEMVALIDLGNTSRHTAATKMNERSSRSHAVFKTTLSQITTTLSKKQFEKPTEHVREAFINLVDLAGSERNKKTGATGERLKEAASINKSLSCLKSVIDVLVENSTSKGPKKRIPYRDSHLTSILMDSLGGNSKTFMLVCLSPHCDNAEETLQTLKYGSKARQIITTVTVNENASSRVMLDLEDELERMKAELDRAQSENQGAEAVEALKAQIEEHETHIHTLESEMKQQQDKIVELREKKEKEMRVRHAAAFNNLHALTRARLKRDEAEFVQRKLSEELGALESEKQELDVRQESTERDLDKLRDMTEAHKQRAAEVEHITEQWKRKATKLEGYCRDLQRAVDEQDAELRRLVSARIGIILRARLRGARIRLDHRKRAAEQQRKTDEELRLLAQSAEATIGKAHTQYAEEEARLEAERSQLQTTLEATLADTQKMVHERDGQIAKLEDEVANLKRENKRKVADNQARVQAAVADWERKHAAMISDMERQYEQAASEWSRRYAEDERAEEEAFRANNDKWAQQLEETQRFWAAKVEEARAAGKRACDEVEQEWNAKLHEGEAVHLELRAKLVDIRKRELQLSDMLHRVSTCLDATAKPSAQNSKEYRALYNLMRDFQLEYEANMPSKFTLEQLLSADYSKSRCDPVPEITGGGGSAAMTPSRRSASPGSATAAATRLKSARVVGRSATPTPTAM